MDIKFPQVEVQLIGQDGNGFMIINRVACALREAKIPKEDIDTYMNDAMDGDYDHLLRVTLETVTIS